MPTITLLSRSYCHLCDEMLEALKGLQSTCAFNIEVIDVDAHHVLLERHDERVPVLLADGIELCHYHLDTKAVIQYLCQGGFSTGTKRLESPPAE